MESKIEELIELLEKTDLRADVKSKGWEYILGLTVAERGLKSLLSQKHISSVLSCLKNYDKDDPSIATVYKCLINISCNREGTLSLLSYKKDLVNDLILNICDSNCKHIESICYILNNLTSHDSILDDVNAFEFYFSHFETLKKLFLSQVVEKREKYRFLALIFANLTRHPEGRKFFLQNDHYLSDIFTTCANHSHSVIRRLGISLTIKNCCFETACHPKLMELNILRNLLLPLMGPEEFEEDVMEKLPIDCQYLEADKKREEHPKIRRALVQALSLLCYTEEGWNYLKENGVYYVIREFHKWETDESVIEAVETLVLYLLVENYETPDSRNKESILDIEPVMPSETDIVKDLPDFII